MFEIPQHHHLGESAHREGGAGRSLRQLSLSGVRCGSGDGPGGHPGRETDYDHPESHKFILNIFQAYRNIQLTWSVVVAGDIMQMLFDKIVLNKICQS